MIQLTEDQVSVLRQGYPVRVEAPQLGGELVVVLAAGRESTECVLQETLDDLRERAAAAKLGKRSASSAGKENSF